MSGGVLSDGVMSDGVLSGWSFVLDSIWHLYSLYRIFPMLQTDVPFPIMFNFQFWKADFTIWHILPYLVQILLCFTLGCSVSEIQLISLFGKNNILSGLPYAILDT